MDRGYYKRLPPARRFIADLLHHAQQVPLLSTGRTIQVQEISELRERTQPRLTWMALFAKAFGLTAQEHPELRTAYIKYPWPRLYVHPHTVLSLPIEREWEGESVALIGKLRSPETMPLKMIAENLLHMQRKPVMRVGSFRQSLRVARFPKLVRRFLFWSTLHFSGAKRAKRLATCTMSSVGRLGAEQFFPRTPLTCYFTFGPVDATGRVDITIIYDHRVMDDGHVARALAGIEKNLLTRVQDEMLEMTSSSTLIAA